MREGRRIGMVDGGIEFRLVERAGSRWEEEGQEGK